MVFFFGLCRDEGARCSRQYQSDLFNEALGMRLQSGFWCEAAEQFCCAQTNRAVLLLILTGHSVQVLPMGSLIGGPGFVSIPALMSSIWREWAGLVPPIFQKTIW